MAQIKQKLFDFIKKYNFLLVCALCLVVSVLAVWLRIYAIVAFLGIIVGFSFIYDVNKMICLCSFAVFFDRTFEFWLFVGYIISLSIICIREIVSKRKKLTKVYIVPFLIFTYFFVSFFLIGFNKSNFTAIAQLVALIGLFIELFFLRDDLDISFIIKSVSLILIASYLASIPFIFLKTRVAVFHDGEIKRYHGFLLHENAVAILTVLLSSFVVSLYYKKKVSLPQLIFFISAFLVMGLLTKSKSFIIGFAIVLLYYLIKEIILNWKKGLIQLGCLLVLLAVVGLVFHEQVYQYFSRFWIYFSDSSFLDRITTGRITIWEHYIGLWVSTPITLLFGCGGSYIFTTYSSTHNAFIDILIKNGLVGLILIISFVVYFLVLTRKEKKNIDNYFLVFLLLVLMIIEALCSNVGLLMCMLTFAYFFIPNGEVEKTNTQKGEVLDEHFNVCK